MEAISDYLARMAGTINDGKYFEAKRCGQEALDKLDIDSCSYRDSYSLYRRLGMAYYGLGEYSSALDAYYKSYLSACKYINDNPRDVIDSLAKLGYNFIPIGNPRQGLIQFQKAERHYQIHRKKFPPNDTLYVHILIGLAYCHMYLGGLEKLGRIMEKLAAFAPFLEDKYLILDYHHIKGEHFTALKEYNEARRAFDECIKISNEVDSPRGVPEAQIHLAIIDLLDGRLAGAIDKLRATLKMSRRLKLNYHTCETALLLSKCYSLNNQTAKSAAIEERIKPILNKLEISWLYEKIRWFDNIYRQLQPVYRTAQYLPDILVKTISKHYQGSVYKDVVVGQSLAMQDVYQQVAKIAPTDLPVLICGGTGTGKEFIARFIYQNSARADKTYLTVNCGGMTEPILEKELFGYAKDSFNGVDQDKKGYIELASDGTLLMDEIGHLPKKIQQKLALVLESRRVWLGGAKKSIPVNTRFLFTTSQDLEQLASRGLFRRDLFHRLNTIILALPALRERRDDIPALIKHLTGRYHKSGDINRVEIAPSALKMLLDYPWPGNILELENEVRRICILNGDFKVITPGMLSDAIRQARPAPAPFPDSDNSTLKELKLAFERDTITGSLAKHNGHLSRTAKQLGLNRVSLYKKMKQLGLK